MGPIYAGRRSIELLIQPRSLLRIFPEGLVPFRGGRIISTGSHPPGIRKDPGNECSLSYLVDHLVRSAHGSEGAAMTKHDLDLDRKADQALVVITLSTATLILSIGLLAFGTG